MGYIMSPGYPNPPPHTKDCQCLLQTETVTNIKLQVYDLALQKGDTQCSDWLMINARENGKRKMYVECGSIAYKVNCLRVNVGGVVRTYCSYIYIYILLIWYIMYSTNLLDSSPLCPRMKNNQILE